MYYGLMLTPTKSGVVPEAKNIVRFLNWLVESGDILSPESGKPIIVETWLGAREEEDTEEEEFVTIDNQLELYLLNHKSWDIFFNDIPYKNKHASGSISYNFRFQKTGEEAEFTRLKTIGISNMNTQAFGWGDWDKDWPDRDFSIVSCTILKIDDDYLEEDYKEIVWEKLVSNGVISEIQEVLGISLEPWPNIC